MLRLLNREVPLARAISFRVMKIPDVYGGLTPARIVRHDLRRCVVAAMDHHHFRDRHRLFGETFEAEPQQLRPADGGDNGGDWLWIQRGHAIRFIQKLEPAGSLQRRAASSE